MKLTMDQLPGFLADTVRGIKAARCTLSKECTANVDFDELIQVSVELIAKDGVNFFERIEESVALPSERRTLKPDEIQRQELGEVVSTSVASGFQGTSKSTKTELKSTETQTTPERTSTSTRVSEPTISDTESWDESGGTTGTGSNGGDTRTTLNTYE